MCKAKEGGASPSSKPSLVQRGIPKTKSSGKLLPQTAKVKFDHFFWERASKKVKPRLKFKLKKIKN